VRSYVTKPTTINAITDTPAKTPRPIGRTCTCLPGISKAAAGEADASTAAAAVPEPAAAEAVSVDGALSEPEAADEEPCIRVRNFDRQELRQPRTLSETAADVAAAESVGAVESVVAEAEAADVADPAPDAGTDEKPLKQSMRLEERYIWIDVQ
jgi:hypothetical protein